ncbi:hypothetical protein [Streptomyces sp. NPDC096132]|uniref:hypothetical protein n=1 Tax=Streptomyces sp. NPDC096132 TaxID=3366075 RepID=UPI003829E1CE
MIKEPLGHAHIGVTVTACAHVRLRLQRDAIDALGTALSTPVITKTVASNDALRRPRLLTLPSTTAAKARSSPAKD